MRPSLVPFFLLFSTSLLSGSPVQQEPTLQLGTSISRTVGRGQSQRFVVALEKDHLAQVVVEQRGIDLVVRVSSPERKYIGDFDSPNGASGPENVKFVATAPGAYFVEVRPLGSETGGQFEIRLTEVRRATEPELEVARRPEVFKAKGLSLLTTFVEMLPELQSVQARVRYQMQAAQLLWRIDDNAARKIAMDAASGLREFIERDPPESADSHERFYGPMQLRQEMFHMLLGQDAEAALTFLRSTRTADLEALRYPGQPDQELQFETMAASNLAVKDSKRAFQIAQEALTKGYPQQLGGVISALRNSDPLLANRLMKEALAKLQDENFSANPEATNLALHLLQTGRPLPRNSIPPGGAAMSDIPLLSPLEYRNLFTKTLEAGLAVEFVPNTYSPEMNMARNVLSSLKNMAEEMRNLAPGKNSLVEERLTQLNAPGNARDRIYREAINSGPANIALESIARAPLDLRDNLYLQLASRVATTDIVHARQIAGFIVNPQQRQNALDSVERQALQAAINAGKLEDAMLGIRNLKSRRERANMVKQIVYRVSQGQKADVAMNLLEQSRALLSVSPRVEDQETLSALLQIAGALSRYDAARGFHIVEPFLDQFNEMTAAALKLNGFGQQYFVSGDLSLQNGNSVGYIATQLTEALAKLATADFDRAKLAVDRIQRPEVRAAAYLAIAQQAINPSTPMMHGVRMVPM
jgi:hypothetical protein